MKFTNRYFSIFLIMVLIFALLFSYSIRKSYHFLEGIESGENIIDNVYNVNIKNQKNNENIVSIINQMPEETVKQENMKLKEYLDVILQSNTFSQFSINNPEFMFLDKINERITLENKKGISQVLCRIINILTELKSKIDSK